MTRTITVEYTDVPIEPKCDCERMPVRVRTLSNGVKAYYPQCVKCGRTGQAVKKDTFTPRQLDQLEPFDDTLQDAWHQKRSDYYRRKHEAVQTHLEQERAEKDVEWWMRYNAYLRTPEWAGKRRRVIQRDPICKGCGVNSSAQAHHITYKHLFNEFLFELVGICVFCHERLTQMDRQAR